MLQICDFGLAKWKQQPATQTTTGHRRGTIRYMAPEVFADPNASRTTKYDVYSFGIVLWEMLSGKQPFDCGINIVCLYHNFVMYDVNYVIYTVHLLCCNNLAIDMMHTVYLCIQTGRLYIICYVYFLGFQLDDVSVCCG